MLSQEQLKVLISDIESDHVERTTSINNTDKFAQAVCAFANDFPNHRQPGYLIIGVSDKGNLSGLTVTDQLLQNLGALHSDGNILPLPSLNVSKFKFDDGEVAVVEVHPSELPPVRYKGQVWLRIGPRKAIASEQDERILIERRTIHALTFDLMPVLNATINNLSLPLFDSYRRQVIDPEIILANNRSLEDQLASLRFFDIKRKVPTVAGVLMFVDNSRYFVLGAYIQFLRIQGTELTDKLSYQKEVAGNLATVLSQLDSLIRANNNVGLEQVSALRERETFDYPEAAIRELLVNAIIHRNYQSSTPVRFYWFDDRIDIQSPGGLYGAVTLTTLKKINSYRNPVIAECVKSIGYANRFGYGIQRAELLLKQNGNPPLIFSAENDTFLVTIRQKKS